MKKSLIATAVAVATWAAPTGTLAQSVNAQTDETQAPGGSEGKQEILEEILVVEALICTALRNGLETGSALLRPSALIRQA